MKKGLLSLLIFMVCFFPSLQAQVLPQDSLALVAFFNSLNGPSGKWFYDGTGRQGGWLKRPVKEWSGITVTGNRVTGIEIRPSTCITTLIGNVPAQIADLTELETFVLQKAYIGKLPKEMTQLLKLKNISIAEHNSTGPDILPAQLATMPSLTTLNIPFTRAAFDQLEPLVDIPNLTYPSLLNLSSPYLTHRVLRGGSITLSFPLAGTSNKYQWLRDGVRISGANQSTYTLTNASDANFGEYTCEVTNTLVTKLKVIKRISVSAFDGLVQDSLALVALYQNTNGDHWITKTNWLTGPLNKWHGVSLERGRVSSVVLSGNNLAGTLPADIGKLTSVSTLFLQENRLTGSIPPEVGTMANLSQLMLSTNQLSGSIPVQLAKLKDLAYLFLENNQLTGSIPSEVGQMTKLIVLLLQSNKLSGTLPGELGNLKNIRNLELSNNALEGAVPESWNDMPLTANPMYSQGLMLANNRLTSVPPALIKRLSNGGLRNINIGSNRLLPSTFAGLNRETYFSLNEYPYNRAFPQEDLENEQMIVLKPEESLHLEAAFGDIDPVSSADFTHVFKGWYRDDLLVSTSSIMDIPAVSAADTGSYTYQIEVLKESGLVCYTWKRKPVTVKVVPCRVPVSLTPETGTQFCQGGSVVLQATPADGHSYTWYHNNMRITRATGASYTAYSSGSYTVEVATDAGCVGTSSEVTVTVSDIAQASIVASGSTSFCFGHQVVLKVQGGSFIAYQWLKNGRPIVGASTNTYETSESGQYSVRVNNTNCSQTTAAVTVSVTTLSDELTVDGLIFCKGSPMLLKAMTGAGISYQWYKDGTAIAGATAATFAALEEGEYNVVLRKGDCLSSTLPFVVSFMELPVATITVNGRQLQAPVAAEHSYQWYKDNQPISGATAATYEMNASGMYQVKVVNIYACETTSKLLAATCSLSVSLTAQGKTIFCKGEKVDLQATENGQWQYQWFQNNVLLAGEQTSKLTASKSGTYRVQATEGLSCKGISADLVVTVQELPQATIQVTQDTVLTALSGQGYTYRWYRNDQVLTQESAQVYRASLSGVYQVEVTAPSTCSALSSSVIIAPSLQASTDSLSFTAAGETKTFTIKANTAWTVTPSVSWLAIRPASATGHATVTVTALANPETAVRTTTFMLNTELVGQKSMHVQVVGIQAPALVTATLPTASNDINVYPNPANQSFFVEAEDGQALNGKATLYTNLGEPVHAQALVVREGKVKEHLTTTHLPAGIYLLKIEIGKRVMHTKILLF